MLYITTYIVINPLIRVIRTYITFLTILSIIILILKINNLDDIFKYTLNFTLNIILNLSLFSLLLSSKCVFFNNTSLYLDLI